MVRIESLISLERPLSDRLDGFNPDFPPITNFTDAVAEQAALEARVVEADPPHGAISIPSDDDDSAAHGSGHDRPLRLVGGLDVSFASDAGAEGDTESAALAALVVLSFPALEVVYEDFLPVRLTQPYVAGYLAFREAPALIDLVRRLRAQRPDMLPELMMVDGNGVLHPRGCGLACHVVRMYGVCMSCVRRYVMMSTFW